MELVVFPGPWEAEFVEHDGWNIASANPAGPVIAVMIGDNEDGLEESNARLMAAAPELLYALKKARACIGGGAKKTRELIDAVIIKAEGKDEKNK